MKKPLTTGCERCVALAAVFAASCAVCPSTAQHAVIGRSAPMQAATRVFNTLNDSVRPMRLGVSLSNRGGSFVVARKGQYDVGVQSPRVLLRAANQFQVLPTEGETRNTSPMTPTHPKRCFAMHCTVTWAVTHSRNHFKPPMRSCPPWSRASWCTPGAAARSITVVFDSELSTQVRVALRYKPISVLVVQRCVGMTRSTSEFTVTLLPTGNGLMSAIEVYDAARGVAMR